MEGVAFSQLDCMSMIKSMGITSKKIIAFGGGMKSKIWKQILSDILNTKLITLNIEEGPSFGVALLAGVGVGIFNSVEEAVDKTIKEISEIDPVEENVKKYKKLYKVYRSLYEDLKSEYIKLAKI